ncbi:hypothetical protein FPQ18DRAFT_345276 [Pyronema domesticum]|nr:hypothetical protein FPQ18DRAFT_345276 [Pyronema domesticum]
MPRTPKKWTEEEDEILRKAVTGQTHGPYKDWHKIASALPGRNNKDCRKRWHYRGNGVIRKGPWKLDEDHRLWTGVQKHGNRWALVAQEVETRNGDQCAKRWQDALDPNLDHSDWVDEDDATLLEAVEKYGRNWKTIVEQYFPRRSRLSAKNRYALLERKREIQDQISSYTIEPRVTRERSSSSSPVLSWSKTPSEAASSPSEQPHVVEEPGVPSILDSCSTTPGSLQDGMKDIIISDYLLHDQKGNDLNSAPEFYPWPLSPAESSGGVLSSDNKSPHFTHQSCPPGTETWTTGFFDDIGFLSDAAPRDGNPDTTDENIFEFSPDVDPLSTEPLGCAGAGLIPHSEIPERLQKYTISVEGATPETIKSVLEILLKTKTQVTINTSL